MIGAMEKLITLESDVFATGQIEPADLAAIARLGIRTIIDHRPDSEISPDLASGEMARAAAQYGIAFLYQPVSGYELDQPEFAATLCRTLSVLPSPVLLYCRSGRRSTILWALASQRRLGQGTVLAVAERSGLPAEDVLPLLEAAQEMAVSPMLETTES